MAFALADWLADESVDARADAWADAWAWTSVSKMAVLKVVQMAYS